MPLSVIILTGQSGSGKSTAVRALEDEGFFCVDNMPSRLAEQLIDMVQTEQACDRLALVMDIRERQFLQQAPALVQRLRQGPHSIRVVFLEANETAMIRRYSTTRRLHPLDRGKGLRSAIAEEHAILAPLRELADETVDTSALSPHQLRSSIIERLAGTHPQDILRVGLLSFGFKYGVPLEADLVFDVRFLTNPYFIEGLRPLTGTDIPVRDFVLQAPEAKTFLRHIDDLLGFLVPQYQHEGKRYLTVAVGCTGGRHRSVAIAGALLPMMAEKGVVAEIRHRDLKEDLK